MAPASDISVLPPGSYRAAHHILVVDDAPKILAHVHELLEDEGYSVTTQVLTADARQVWDVVKRISPDLVILDYMRRGADVGYTVLRLLRDDPETLRTPIIMCTAAKGRIETLRPELSALDVEIVLKPFDLDHLVRTIANSLGPVLVSIPYRAPVLPGTASASLLSSAD